MLKLNLQYFGHVMWRADWLEKTLMLGKIEGRRRRGGRGWGGWMASMTQWTWVWANSKKMMKDSEVWRATVHGVTESWTQLAGWKITTTTIRFRDTSLVIQCLRLCLPMQGVRLQSLVWELRSHMPHGKKKNNPEQKRQKWYCNKFNKDLK